MDIQFVPAGVPWQVQCWLMLYGAAMMFGAMVVGDLVAWRVLRRARKS